ncbi:lateral flagellar FliI-like assembly ATPase protein [Oceanimonas sp. GK1]|uniref:FliI/YscN family ATPase n=1 Tax=Oceanimonas sp. (strain GK1 / IBRC-M 10197) TaxID=511062 RepID=UPI0002495695|nr:FliI/YscN family ATPase [Oceanimonas sp. GK1]AEY02564.1 lateral flagellar FliI-like assembly ATPase protein [Oceanimonas sp. GK1]
MSLLEHRLQLARAALSEELDIGQVYGRLLRVTGNLLEVSGCRLVLGQRCCIDTDGGGELEAEVVALDREQALLLPLTSASGLYTGARVRPLAGEDRLAVSAALLGRIVDGLLRPLDGRPPAQGQPVPWQCAAPNPLLRRRVSEPLDVGVRAINGLLTPGKGQRLGLFAGPGVGKSVLLGMMARYTRADVVVVGLIGERGREVREFIDDCLGAQGRARSVVIAAPADQSPLMRVRAAESCHRVAEHFRDQGQDVLLLMDSLTRYVQARREIGLAVGEPPVARGYPPSAFSALTGLVERAGNGEQPAGSLTAFYTVLAEGDDQQDPVADAARAILDGHVVLSRQLAEQGHYPAIDIGASISRVMSKVAGPDHLARAVQCKRWFGLYQQVRELLPLGGIQSGKSQETDEAIARYPALAAFLQQGELEPVSLAETLQQLAELTGDTRAQPSD